MIKPLLTWIKQQRAHVVNPRPADAWTIFADAEKGYIFCHDFSTGRSSDDFVPAAVAASLLPSVLPPAVLEPSAARIAEASASCWPRLRGKELLSAAKAQLWDGARKAARVAQLSACPCPLDHLLQMAQYLGVEPTAHPQLLWLAHAALTPEMPLGWASAKSDEGDTYYFHAGWGLSQWEHPHVSFLSGVAARLVKER